MKMDFDKSHSRSFRFERENKSTKLLRQLNVMVCDNRKSHQQQYYSQNTFHSLSFLPTTPTQAEDHLPSW